MKELEQLLVCFNPPFIPENLRRLLENFSKSEVTRIDLNDDIEIGKYRISKSTEKILGIPIGVSYYLTSPFSDEKKELRECWVYFLGSNVYAEYPMYFCVREGMKELVSGHSRFYPCEMEMEKLIGLVLVYPRESLSSFPRAVAILPKE